MKWFRWIRFQIRWWKWFLGGPNVAELMGEDKSSRDIIYRRHDDKEPKEG